MNYNGREKMTSQQRKAIREQVSERQKRVRLKDIKLEVERGLSRYVTFNRPQALALWRLVMELPPDATVSIIDNMGSTLYAVSSLGHRYKLTSEGGWIFVDKVGNEVAKK
jgi:hypothetical protein